MKLTQFLSTMVLLFSAVVSAESLEVTSKHVFQSLQSQLNELKRDGRLSETSVTALVETALLPHIDKKYFTYKALGKNLAKLNEEERQTFMTHLTQRLIKSYVGPLLKFDNESFQIVETRYAQSGKTAVTNMKVIGSGRNTSMQTKWRFVQETESWLMYDLVVEGISLLQTQQKELSLQLAKSSVEDVIEKLKKA